MTITTAMILAAGRGTRMRHLTDNCPKPLLRVNQKYLIEYHIEALVKAGIKRIIINTAYLGHMLPEALGNGERYSTDIIYSHEKELGLETAGGIINALPLLGKAPFIVVNADVWSDYNFKNLTLENGLLAKLILIDNPEHNASGDFGIEKGLLNNSSSPKYTFSGISIFHPQFFDGLPEGFLPLREPLKEAMNKQLVGAEYYAGEWRDIGTPERLVELDKALS